jgi:hypothetical protein
VKQQSKEKNRAMLDLRKYFGKPLTSGGMRKLAELLDRG